MITKTIEVEETVGTLEIIVKRENDTYKIRIEHEWHNDNFYFTDYAAIKEFTNTLSRMVDCAASGKEQKLNTSK